MVEKAWKSLRSLLRVLLLTSARRFLSEPLWILQGMGSAVGILVILWIWGRSLGLSNAIVGLAVSSYLGLRVNMAGQMLDCYKIQEIMSVFAASPISPLRLASGIFAGFLIVEAVSLLPLAVLGILIGDTGLAIVSLLASLPLLLISTNFRIFIGLGIRSPTNVSAITNTVTGILTILSPVFYPAEVLPRGVREITLLTPTAYTAELARVLVGLGSSVDIPWLAAVEVLWISVSTALVAKVPKWGRQ